MARFAAAVVLALATAGSLAGGLPPSAQPDFDHSDLDVILRAVVRDESVDYTAVRERFAAALTSYLDRIDGIESDTIKGDAGLALLINLYNATAMRAVADRSEPGYAVSRNDFGIFDEPLVRLSGETFSLDHLEHEIIRKRYDEPRVHVALVCAARSCPPLLNRAYRASDLGRVLDQNMRRFLEDPSRNRIDHDARRLELSRIFDWYADDFGGRDRLSVYVDRYVERDVSGYAIGFLEYSWELNRAD